MAEKDEIFSVTKPAKLMYTMLSAASALIAFGLETSHIYFFTPGSLALAIITPTLLMMLYCLLDGIKTLWCVRDSFEQLGRSACDKIKKEKSKEPFSSFLRANFVILSKHCDSQDSENMSLSA